MARGKGKGRRGGKGGKSRDAAPGGTDDSWRTTEVIEKADMHNERFEAYYKAQNVLSEGEWDAFLESMKEPLPTTFRVTGSRQVAQLLNDMIKDTHAPQLAGVVFEGEAVAPPKQIPWYPDGLAWQLNVAKKVLRKSPEFKKFHNFLVFETEVGNISRQEAVSMLPPLFLEVEPHHRVMDMCAAPGSKTAQLLEALHAHDTVTASSFPSGLLVANDSDHKRTHMLIHQAARLPSPSLMVTNHDASIFPAIKIPSEQLAFPEGTKTRVVNKRQHQLLFDRILCDVPCSGDGTMRKNPGIWKHWSPMDGNGLHGLQLRILERAMRMLQKGGRIVYSTCSINPVENEAVVAAALKSIPGFELVDMSNHLPGLIFRPGIKTWTPFVDRFVTTKFPTYQAYLESLPENKRADAKLVESHWPPTPAEADALHLEYCMRIYPHLQDTGGFFVAVLQKKQPPAPARQGPENKRNADTVEDLETSDTKKPKLSAEDDAEAADDEALATTPEPVPEAAPDAEAAAPEPATDAKGKGKGRATQGADIHFKENPFTFLKPDDPVIQTCISQLQLQADFPAANMLIRNPTGDTVRSIYMTNDIVKQIVESNDYTRMRLVTCGTKVVAKQEGAAAKRDSAEMQFRILSEGLPAMLPYVAPASILSADLATLKVMMETYYPVLSQFQEPFRSAIAPKAQGCCIVRFAQGRLGTAALAHDLVLPVWKSNVSVTLMIEKKAKSALSLRVFGEDITTAAREAAQQRRDQQARSQAPSAEAAPPEADVVREEGAGSEGQADAPTGPPMGTGA
ncbi:RsmB/NOP family class I SAM-dependent RNA methyltransferase [Phanerochaete sordida]|uniref:RsmB/NOP family class I SAM-dependent RNA methyltransferase n=1 Tax=Phanerochaete sordida TaxID=48140 RepID=A0A9P3G1D1_9APHY|nr:RsmB/NOP family class I SAM-dependent RNA methyltransferase [Phanerochaete sordida]